MSFSMCPLTRHELPYCSVSTYHTSTRSIHTGQSLPCPPRRHAAEPAPLPTDWSCADMTGAVVVYETDEDAVRGLLGGSLKDGNDLD